MKYLARGKSLFIGRMLVRLLAPLSFVALVASVSYLHSKEIAGELVTLLSIVMVCSTIGRLGFDQLMLERGLDRRDVKPTVSSCLVLGALLSALAASIFVAAVYLLEALSVFEPIAGPTLVVICILASFAQLSSTFAQSRLHTSLATLLFPLLTYLLAFSGLVLLQLPLLTSALIASAIPALVGLLFLRKADAIFTKKIDWSVAGQSKYFAMNNIAALSYNWLINIYVAAFLGPADVVLFTLITRIAAILSLPATASTPLIQAGISAKHKSGESRSVAKFSGMIVLATAALQALCILALFIVGVFTDHLNGLLDSGLLIAFLIYCLTQIFHVLAGPAGSILLMTGEAKRVSRLTVILGASSLVFGMAFTWMFGLAGTLFVSGAISLIQNLCYNVMLYQRDGYLPVQAALSSILKFRKAAAPSSQT
jgi:O-antigen/teichoic acid export membrane protein